MLFFLRYGYPSSGLQTLQSTYRILYLAHHGSFLTISAHTGVIAAVTGVTRKILVWVPSLTRSRRQTAISGNGRKTNSNRQFICRNTAEESSQKHWQGVLELRGEIFQVSPKRARILYPGPILKAKLWNLSVKAVRIPFSHIQGDIESCLEMKLKGDSTDPGYESHHEDQENGGKNIKSIPNTRGRYDSLKVASVSFLLLWVFIYS